jgi:hypothetical protein
MCSNARHDAERATPKSVLLPFHDDSTLISATKLAEVLTPYDFMPIFALVSGGRRKQISDRQIRDTLNRKPDLVVSHGKVASETFLSSFDVVACAKYPPAMVRNWFERRWRFEEHRPCFVGTFPGMDFTPTIGIRARRFLDIVCVNSRRDLEHYRSIIPASLQRSQVALQFSPLFYRADDRPAPERRPIRHVVFFTQSIVPPTLAGRAEMLDLLIRTARANPSVRLTMKLRHLANENRGHSHQEAFAYQMIARHLARPLPTNMFWSAASMRDVLRDADLCITCSSSAGLEAIAAGVPASFFIDFCDADQSALTEGMRAILMGSNLPVSRDDILCLRHREADPAWLRTVLSGPEHVAQLHTAISDFLDHTHRRPLPGPDRLSAVARRLRPPLRRLARRVLG